MKCQQCERPALYEFGVQSSLKGVIGQLFGGDPAICEHTP
jgi:hypothetical protein